MDDVHGEDVPEVGLGDVSESDSDSEFLLSYEPDHVEDPDDHLPIDSEDSDVEDIVRRVPRGPIHNPNCNMKDVRLELGMQFSNLKEFKIAVKDYAICGGFQLKFVHNDKLRCHLVCKGSITCPWKVWCSKIIGESTYQIKTLVDKHNCTRLFVNQQASADWLSLRIVDKIRLEPDISLTDLLPWVSENFQLDITLSQAFRAKKKAKEIIEGSAREQYARIRDYCAEIRDKNVGSTCIVQVDRFTNDSHPQFKRIYMCLDALKKGILEGCRPLIGLDGCFLKGSYKGQLLTAVGQDGNGHIYPIAWAIVLVENTDNWSWFMGHLMDDLGMNREWTFISGQQKGLENVFRTMLSGFENRLCIRHLYNNFNKEHKGVQLKRQFYNIARVTTIEEFEFEMCRMKTISEAAWKWLDDRSDRLWSRAKFRNTCKNDIMLNNISESYNGKILKHRAKPIITFLEELRKDAMKRIVKLSRKMETSNSNGPLVPTVQNRIDNLTDISRKWEAIWSGDATHFLFEVTCRPEKYVVHIGDSTCSCRVWDLTGIPCCHGIAALRYIGLPIEQHLSHYFTKATYLRVYNHIIHPLNGMNMYPKSHSEALLPPPLRTKLGRPQVKRRREDGEVQNASMLRRSYPLIKCDKCGQTGHNKRGCKVSTGVGAAGVRGRDSGMSNVHINPNVASTSRSTNRVRNVGQRRGSVPRRQGGVVRRRGSNITSETVSAATSSIRVASILQASQESVCTNDGS